MSSVVNLFSQEVNEGWDGMLRTTAVTVTSINSRRSSDVPVLPLGGNMRADSNISVKSTWRLKLRLG